MENASHHVVEGDRYRFLSSRSVTFMTFFMSYITNIIAESIFSNIFLKNGIDKYAFGMYNIYSDYLQEA